MEGEGFVSERVGQRWFQRFNTGEENTKDLPRSGRSKLWDIENLRRGLEENLQKVLIDCKKNMENHTETVDLYLMN